LRRYPVLVGCISFIAAGLLMAACNDSTGTGSTGCGQGVLTGHVYLIDSRRPIHGVSVSCGGQVDTTGKSGRFLLNGIPEGAHVLSALHQLYEPYQTTIMIRGEVRDSFDIFLTPKALSPLPVASSRESGS